MQTGPGKRKGTDQRDAVDGSTILIGTTVASTLNFFTGHADHMRKHGARVFFVSNFSTTSPDKLAATGVRHIPMARSWDLIGDVRSLVQWRRVLRAIGPDILHVSTPKAALLSTLAARTLRRANRPRIVVSLFGVRQQVMTGPAKAFLDFTTRLTTYTADVVWLDSASSARYAQLNRLVPCGRARVLHKGSVDGVDSRDRFNPELPWAADARRRKRAELGVDASTLVVGFIGRITRDKGIGELLEAYAMLRQKFPNPVHLVLLGPSEADAATILEGTDSIPSIHVLPPTQEVAPWLATFDVFVMPSHREGFGVSNIEAASMGLPVVSTLIPGCVDSVADGRTGTLVPPNNPNELCKAILLYLSDPDLREEHGQAGRDRVVQDFQPEALRSALRALYGEVLREIPTVRTWSLPISPRPRADW